MPRSGRASRSAAFVPRLDDTDVYICGPRDWSDGVIAEARAAGMAPEQIHHERFDW
jgi:ferredoxin-NADP reductase